ncbi:hypothetical protein [Rhodococcus sp. NPDC047139]|uniref:hypothetical protein n=1 Tax=Rhodococcus sp. NPDC047139 TaxID=3155141 RepID=UPI0033DC7241
MSGTTLAGRIAAAKAQLDAVYREVRAIAEAAGMYDPETFGEAGEASLLEVIDSLADVNLAIGQADAPFESAEWHARKLGI